MAAIGINVDEAGLWSVGLDKYEWTALIADGTTVNKVNNEWKFGQPVTGDFKFVATAVGTEVINNENQAWIIEQEVGVYYLLTLDYKPTNTNGVSGFILTGRGAKFGNKIFPTSANPVNFSQGKMTGLFSVKQG